MNILFHSGDKVLYSVLVCKREFTISTTQKGSLFPPISAAANPSALKTDKIDKKLNDARKANLYFLKDTFNR